MAKATLKVTVSELKTQAQGIDEEITKIETSWEELSTLVNNSITYWMGEASNQHRKILSHHKEAMEGLIKKLNQHPKDLREMAEVYQKTEKEAQSLSNALPKDVIV